MTMTQTLKDRIAELRKRGYSPSDAYWIAADEMAIENESVWRAGRVGLADDH